MKMERMGRWLEDRLPAGAFWRRHFSQYRVPKNLNFWYFFGAVVLFVLLMEGVTGFFMAVHYKPFTGLDAAGMPVAYASMQSLMHEVPWGWLLRRAHALGASALFALIYLHVGRALLYGSYRKPRELVWLFGMALWLLCLVEAFLGRLLPWSQDGYWATTVVVNLFSGIPLIGADLALWIRGGVAVGEATLGRFFALHVLAVPLLLLLFIALHVISVRVVGSGNPDGVDISLDKMGPDRVAGGLPYHPYFTVRDLLALLVFLLIFAGLVFFASDEVLHWLGVMPLIPADPLQTPERIAPAWYFAPWFAMLRSVHWAAFGIDSQFWGGLVVMASILMLALLPWLDASPVKSIRYRGPLTKIFLTLLILSYVLLGILGLLPGTPQADLLAKMASLYYFAFFLLMPVWTRLDRYQLPSELK
ncbi:MAG: cytochrome b [Betaproteobacteria bacterium ADurb.Bin341]|nr:MAG: cytochrome b [Betaproteobacteria bacterium ADurb.Bin341]